VYIARHLEAGEQASGALSARLRVAIGDLRTRLEAADTALQSYARESGIILTPDQSSVSQERLRQIQDALSRAEADRVQKQARSEAVSQTGAQDLASVLNDPVITSGQEKFADLQRQRAELSVTYTPDYPKVKRLDAQIESVGVAIRLQITDAAGRIRSEYEQARRREAMLSESYQTQRAAVLEEGDKRGHYAVLKSEADSTRALYDTVLARVKETGIASAMRDTNVRVLDRAVPASTPFQPRRAQAFLMGAIAGLLIGFFITHNLEEADRTLRAPGEYTVTALSRRRGKARVWDYERAARRRQDIGQGRARRGFRMDRQTRVSDSRSDFRRRNAEAASEAASCGK
jgi:succinoglycan biosynthesis transport protein ExoP